MKRMITAAALMTVLLGSGIPAGLGPGTAMAAPKSYSITAIGPVPDAGCPVVQSGGINSTGIVVGTVYTAGCVPEAFSWTATGGTVMLPGGLANYALAINDSDQIAGANYDGVRPLVATVWQNGSVISVDQRPASTGSWGTAISRLGEVVGWDIDGSFSWTPAGGMVRLDTSAIGGMWAEAVGVNSKGTVVGHINTGQYSCCFPVVWQAGVPEVLGDGTYGSANAINDRGQVAGRMGNVFQAFIWSAKSGVINLGAPQGQNNSEGLAINSMGDVVGSTYGSSGTGGFAYIHGVMSNVLDLISNGSGWTNLVPNGINDNRQMVGMGYLNGQQRCFLISPN